MKKRVLYSPFLVYLLDQLRGSCDIFGGQCGSKEARMAEQYILNMEDGQIQREMPVLRPYDVVEYRGVQQSPAPTRSIVYSPFLVYLLDQLRGSCDSSLETVVIQGGSRGLGGMPPQTVMFPIETNSVRKIFAWKGQLSPPPKSSSEYVSKSQR